MRRLFCLLAALASFHAAAEKLTLDRINDEPNLSGPGMHKLEISPDGSRVTFLRGRPDDRFRQDLWEYNLKDKRTRRLVNASLLVPKELLSEDEKSRRERARTAELSGILDYSWSPDGKQLLVPIAGDLFLVDVARPEAARKVASGSAGDPQISPKGRYLSFVRDQNLFVIELATGVEKQLTSDGAGTVHNGEAEFIAQEEMGQSSGYYWAPDDSAIAYKRYDEAPVPNVRRAEIHAGHFQIVEQRYPTVGGANVAVDLMIVSPATGVQRKVDLGPERDIYLFRADWTPDARELFFQRKSRNHRRLDLVAVDAATLAQRTVLTETSSTWVNTSEDLRFLDKGRSFLWSSERSGRKHLYLYDISGRLRHAVSSGAWGIDSLAGVDEKAGMAYVESNRDAVIDTQVYRLALDGGTADSPTRITRADGTHRARFARNGELYFDHFSDTETPYQVSLRRADGSLVEWLDRNEVDASHPYFRYRDEHLKTEFGTLKASDGQQMHWMMIKPSGFDPAKRYPVFVSVYGGPLMQMVTRSWPDPVYQYMAQQGYVVWALDNRGSSRRERAFTDTIHGHLGTTEVDDQVAGIDWLRSQPYIDPARIGVFGWSYGGTMSLLLLARASDKVAAAVSVAPGTDWSLYDTYYTEQYMGSTPQSDPGAYARGSALASAGSIRSKLLLVHGMADDNCIFINTTRLIDTLVGHGIDFDLMTYPGEKHGMSSRPATRHLWRLVDNFMRANVGK